MTASGPPTSSAAPSCHHDVTSEDEWGGGPSPVPSSCTADWTCWSTTPRSTVRPPLRETEPDEYRRVIEVNQVGVYLGMREVCAGADRARGRLDHQYFLGRGHARRPPAGFAYAASKWAVRGMTKSAAVQLGPHGVRVNSIHPGLIDTVMLGETRIVQRGNLDAAVERIPLRRIGRPEEVARLALFPRLGRERLQHRLRVHRRWRLAGLTRPARRLDAWRSLRPAHSRRAGGGRDGQARGQGRR